MRRRRLSMVILTAALLSSNVQPERAHAQGTGDFGPYEGTYRLESGAIVVVSRVGVVQALARPYFVDWQTERFGYLVPAGSDRYAAAASAAAKPDAPARTGITFERNDAGSVVGLTIEEDEAPARRAKRVELFVDRDVVVPNGEARLAATIRTPVGTGPFPGIVLVHGSGPGERTQLSLMNAFFARLGLAVLTYDKRGCGGSGGDWKTVDLDVLAQDALAAVRWLKAQPEIDKDRVGLWGISQGGWIVPLAASLDPGVAFAINSSGPATSLRRQDTFMMTNTLKLQGFETQDIELVLKALGLLYDFGRGKATSDALDTAMDQVRAHPKLTDLAFPPAREISRDALYAKQKIGDPAWFFHLNPDNDAIAPYRLVRCPMLVTYGRLDYTVPVEESVRLLRGLAAGSGRRNLTATTISDSGHGYLRMQEAQPMSPVVPTTISREFFTVIEGWLAAQGIISGTER